MTDEADAGRSATALDGTLVSGFRWNALGKLAGQVLAWSSTFVVVRLLTPGDYGIVAMAGVVFGLAVLIGDGGLGGAILNRRETRPEVLGQLTTISICLGLVATAVTLALALPIASYFHEPRLRGLVAVASIAYLVLGFRAVPLAVLQRDLAFKIIARNDFLMAATTSVSAIALALLGAEYWALIIAPVLGALVATISAWHARPQQLRIPQPADLKDTLSFGMHLMVSRVSGYAGSQADSLIIGRVLGKPPLGAYRVAMDLASLPIDKVAGLILQVTTPILAAVRGDRDATARYLLRITEVVALVSWPLAIGLALVADPAVLVVLGQQWAPAIVPLQLLAIAGVARTVTPLLSGVILASGDARFVGRLSFWLTLASVPALIAASPFGLPAIAAAVGLVAVLTMLMLLHRALRITHIPFTSYVLALKPALVGCVVMTATVVTGKHLAPLTWSPAVCLVAFVALGAIAYASTVYLLAGRLVTALMARVWSRDLAGPGLLNPEEK